MKNYKLIYTILIVLAGSLVACEPDFGDTNDNPNTTTKPIASSLLTNAINGVFIPVIATQGQHYVQYLANSQYTSADNYQTIQFDYSNYFSGPLMDLQQVIDLNTDAETKEEARAYGSNINQIAVARILQSYYFLHLTDRWGDLPYTEALRIRDGIRQPAFDTQESIYNGLFETLTNAQNAISGLDPVIGDNLFGGDMEMWKKFANTLRLVMSLRISKIAPDRGAMEFNAALNDGIIALDNSENILYMHLAEESFDNIWYDRFETRRDYCVANTLVDRMQVTANGGVLDVGMDPRLPVYADPTENGNNYVGMPYGLSEARAGAISNSEVSFLGEMLRQQTSPTYLFTSAQVLFSMAEAAALGWISQDPGELYYAAIMASLSQYGVEEGYAMYISNSWVIFNPDSAIEQIITQKWIANFLNGYDAWADWRRTGYPMLLPAEDALNQSGEIPVRQAYPSFERDLNSDNYEAVVARQGEDGLDTYVWWDVD